MKLNIKVTNDGLASNGAWVDWPRVDGVSVKMKRSSTIESQKQLNKYAKQNRKALRTSELELQKQITINFLAEHIIVDWKGLTDDGKEFKYTIENAKLALADDQDFFNFINVECDNSINFADDIDDTSTEERGEELKK